jgi:anti-sigma factor RsiW
MARLRRKDREHQYVSDRLAAYMDEELVPRERARVETHLSTCEECRVDLRTLRWTKGLLRQAPTIKIPRSFVVREADVAPLRPVRRRVPMLAAQWATAAVALLFVLVLGGDLLTGAPMTGARRAAPQPEMAWVEQEAPKAVVVEEVAAVPAEGTPTLLMAETEVTQVVEKEAAVEVEGTKVVEKEVVVEVEGTKAAEEEMMIAAPEPSGKPEDQVPRSEYAPTSVADETAEKPEVERETKGVGDAHVVTPTPAAKVLASQAETADVAPTPLPEAVEAPVAERGEGEQPAPPAAVMGVEEDLGEATIHPGSRVAWRVAEVVLGLAFLGLLIAVIWMRRQG